MHAQVSKANASEKIWLEPEVTIAYMHRFTNAEEHTILEIESSNFEEIKSYWNEYFSK